MSTSNSAWFVPSWPNGDHRSTVLKLALKKSFSVVHRKREGGKQFPTHHAEANSILKSLLKQSNDAERPQGRSLLVTGYRGVGKTSCVKRALHEHSEECQKRFNVSESSNDNQIPVIVELDLSSITSAHDLLLLLAESLTDRLDDDGWWGKSTSTPPKVDEPSKKLLRGVRSLMYRQCLKPLRADTLHSSFIQTDSNIYAKGQVGHSSFSVERHLSLYQHRFRDILEKLIKQDYTASGKKFRLQIIFLVDELDKLPVRIGSSNAEQSEEQRFSEVQKIVADLKFLLTESGSTQIFIAGKDVEDAWHADRNKREGLFESIFPLNVYIPSLFGIESPANTPITKNGPDPENALLACGLTRQSLTFRVARSVIAELDDHEIELLNSHYKALAEGGDSPEQTTQLSCYLLRVFMQYLTYKGRGIPRKVMREFYGHVKSEEVGHESKWFLELSLLDIQRMSFYARIMDRLELHFDRFQSLTDKGKISIFYMIDHVLKFYETGFTASEISSAEAASTRQEMFPTQWLAVEVINVLEGPFVRRRSPRSGEYHLLPNIKLDLEYLVRNFAGEQVELRFVHTDFEDEIRQLSERISRMDEFASAERIESVIGQMRLAALLERLGKRGEARIAYGKAARWLRGDVLLFEEKAGGVDGSGGMGQKLAREFHLSYVSYLGQALCRIGRLYEEDQDLFGAVRNYQESIRLMESVSEARQLRPVGNRGWTVEQVPEHLMINPGDLEEAVFYTWAPLDYSQGVRPLSLENEPQGYVAALIHAALAHEKLWERSAANRYLLKALNYLHRINDEYGVIEHMQTIAAVMMRRRDLRLAALWYLRAIELGVQLREFHTIGPDPSGVGPDRSGYRWTTVALPTETRATLLMYLGDVLMATGCWGAPLDTKDFREDRERPAWLVSMVRRVDTLLEKLDKRELPQAEVDNGQAAKSRTQSLASRLYEHALAAVEPGGHASETFDVLLRLLHLHSGDLIKAMQYSTETETIEAAWGLFWKYARRMLYRLLQTNPSLFRDRNNKWGRVPERRRLGQLCRYSAEIFKELAIRLGSSNNHVVKEFYDKVLKNPQPDGGWWSEILSTLCGKQRPFGWRVRPAVDSLSTLAGFTSLIGKLEEVPESEAAKTITVQKIDVMDVIAWAEILGVSAFTLQRFSVEDSRLGRSCLTLGQIYTVQIIELGRFRKSYCALKPQPNIHALAKRYLVKAVSVFEQDPGRRRVARPSLSEAYFCLGDLLLMRAEILTRETNVCSSLFPGISADCFKQIASSSGKPDEDLDATNAKRQAMEYYLKGLQVIGEEMDDFLNRFRMKADIFTAHQNLMDPVTHLDICRVTQMRHSFATKAPNELQLRTNAEFYRARVAVAIEAPRNPFLEWDAWLEQLKAVLDVVGEVRSDRSPIQIVQKRESASRLNWAALHGRSHTLLYYC
jgi:tetratricopeptide (TPR) repeat protein